MTRYLLVVNFEGGVGRDADGGVEAGGGHGAPRLLPRPAPGAGRQRRAGRVRGPGAARPGQDRHLRRRHAPVVTDGPFQEFKEWLAGYQIVDVESEERAIEIAAKISAVPGPGGVPTAAADPGAAGDGPARRPTPPRWTRSCSTWAASAERAAGVEDLLRELAPQVLGALVRRYRRLRRRRGRRPGGAARRRRALAARRRPGEPARLAGADRRAAADRPVAQRPVAAGPGEPRRGGRRSRRARCSDRDDTLIVLFMCCHPALTPASAIALTLRAVGGLTTAEIASAFLVAEATMAQRISRAKQRIKASGVPFRLPTRDEQPARLRSVLHVLYLIFNEGYASSSGRELQRTELSDEAIRLTRMVQRLLPDDAEVAGLLALMLLIDARRAGADRRRRASSSRWPSRTARSGTGRRSPRGSRCSTDAIGEGRGRRVPAPGGDRGRPRPGAATPTTPTGRRSSRSTGCSSR